MNVMIETIGRRICIEGGTPGMKFLTIVIKVFVEEHNI